MVATSYPRFEADPSAVFLRHLAKAIGGQGHAVHVLAPDDPAADSSLTDKNVRVHRFGYFPIGTTRLAYGSGILPNLRASRALYLQLPFFLLAFCVSMFLLARQLRPDVIHAHWIIPTGFIAVIVGWLLGIPVVTTVHGGDAFSLRSPVIRWFKGFTLKHSACWSANTYATAVAAKAESDVAAPVVIPMGVDTRLFASGNRNLHRSMLDKDDQVVLFVGRLVEKKGCDVLIRAFQQVVRQRHDNTRLWIVGDGKERATLETLVEKAGLTDKVRFFGGQPNQCLADVYAGADWFALPSIEDSTGDTEGQGVVLVEAMAAGLPVIASRTGGVEEVVDDRVTGLLVVPSDVDALAETLHACLDNEDFRMTAARQARYRARDYDWSVIAVRFLDLFVSLGAVKKRV